MAVSIFSPIPTRLAEYLSTEISLYFNVLLLLHCCCLTLESALCFDSKYAYVARESLCLKSPNSPWRGTTVISFDDWAHVLVEVVPSGRLRVYREAIIKFRHWLREIGKPHALQFSKNTSVGNNPVVHLSASLSDKRHCDSPIAKDETQAGQQCVFVEW